jgi:hypothetical protein
LVNNEKTRFGAKTLQAWFDSQKVRGPEAVVDYLETLLFAVRIPQAAKDRVCQLLRQKGQLTEGLHVLCTLPEFQLS